MADYRVNLDVFAGPLDLLLYLVRKDEVEIYDIPIAGITEQYLRYINMLKSLNVDVASEFLVMAATLMQIKSAMLLPKVSDSELSEEDLTDPRTELIRQLLEYKKFKDAANLLGSAVEQQRQRFSRPDAVMEELKSEKEPEVDIEQVSVWDLLEAFSSIMEATGGTVDISHIDDDTPIDLYQVEILHRLQTDGTLKFEKIFESKARLVMIGMFLALLELIRETLICVEQANPDGPIHLRALTDEPAEEVVKRAIISAEEAEAEKVAEIKDEQPVVPIIELPPKRKKERKKAKHQNQQPSIPIVEVDSKVKTSSEKQKSEQIKNRQE